ncbi:hypothetical protein BCF74_11387 [Knoellia remsis]|uniref:Uncharacterized protein n=1 Tax=Knoellia remsis TaxID=407159 RepID=A0A2T0UJP6_9MICO|nr:hypothetical protein BCF74_11387 [Knoellia remsis]
MFAISPIEGLFAVLWAAGVLLAIYLVKATRGDGGAVIALVASLLPAIGWIAPLVILLRRRAGAGVSATSRT